MNNSKLVRLLKALQADEFRRLGKFLRSPYNNANPKIVSLYDYLRRFYPSFDGGGMTKERAFRKLFPGDTYNNKSIGNLMSEMSLRIEDYFVALELKQNKTYRQKLLIKAFGRRHLYHHFEKRTNNLIETMEILPYRDKDHYFSLMELYSEHYFHPATHKYSDAAPSMQAAMNNLDLFFILAKLDWSMELMEWERISGKQFDIRLLAEVKSTMAQLPEEEYPILGIYKNLFDFVETPTEDNYFLLKAAFVKELDAFTKSIQQSILPKLLNFTAKQIAKGQFSYYKEYLELNKIGLRTGVFIEFDQFGDTLYTNIAIAGSLLKEFDWTRQFLDEYEKYLQADLRQAAKMIGLAHLYFHQQNFKKAIDLLMELNTTKKDYLLRARSLNLRSYYELFVKDHSYYEMFEYETKSYERFIKRKALLTDHRLKAYQSLSSYSRHMARIAMNPNQKNKRIAKLKSEVEAAKYIVAKRWLLQKIDMLSN